MFVVGSAVLTAISWRTLFNPRSHGFYRFFAWEAIAALILWNLPQWFAQPFSGRQLLSWTLLVASAYLVCDGGMRFIGARRSEHRQEPELFAFERTAELVTSGIYRYIRHPLYGSLLYLAWGAFLKDISFVSALLVLIASVGLLGTMLAEEQECLQVFGEEYRSYMKHTKRVVPFLL